LDHVLFFIKLDYFKFHSPLYDLVDDFSPGNNYDLSASLGKIYHNINSVEIFLSGYETPQVFNNWISFDMKAHYLLNPTATI
jgi:hypothetical protein